MDKRLFTGLVGRPPDDPPDDLEMESDTDAPKPLTEVITEPTEPTSIQKPGKPGRPRKHSDSATKQKAYRERKASERDIENVRAEHYDNRGQFLEQADHGRGKPVSGGYGTKKLDEVTAGATSERDRDECGRHVQAKGYGPDVDSVADSNETDRTYTNKIRFPKINKLDDAEKLDILVDFACENTEEEPCQEPCRHVVRCLLCNKILGISRWNVDGDGFTLNHFRSEHLRLVQQIWKERASKAAPKPCSEDHIGTAKRLGAVGTIGRIYCKRCRKLIYDPSDPRSPYFRNGSANGNKSSRVSELIEKMNLDPMRGEHTSLPHPETNHQDIPQDIPNKEVAHERDAA